MRSSRLSLAAAVLAVSTAAIAQVASEPQGYGQQPTPKRKTKAEKKAAKRARRNAGVGASQPAEPKWICPRCKVDRFKEPCGDPHHPPCALTAAAYGVDSVDGSGGE